MLNCKQNYYSQTIIVSKGELLEIVTILFKVTAATHTYFQVLVTSSALKLEL